MYEFMFTKSEADNLIKKIAHNMRDVAFLRFHLMVFERDPSNYAIFDKKFYSEELIKLVDMYTKDYSETIIFKDLAQRVVDGKLKKEDAIAEVDKYIDAVESFKQIIRKELEVKNDTNLQL